MKPLRTRVGGVVGYSEKTIFFIARKSASAKGAQTFVPIKSEKTRTNAAICGALKRKRIFPVRARAKQSLYKAAFCHQSVTNAFLRSKAARKRGSNLYFFWTKTFCSKIKVCNHRALTFSNGRSAEAAARAYARLPVKLKARASTLSACP